MGAAPASYTPAPTYGQSPSYVSPAPPISTMAGPATMLPSAASMVAMPPQQGAGIASAPSMIAMPSMVTNPYAGYAQSAATGGMPMQGNVPSTAPMAEPVAMQMPAAAPV